MPPFHVMLKPRGPICNLDCAYCFYLKKEQLYPGAAFRMTPALLEDFTRQYIQSQAEQGVPEVVFAFQGGEPTLMGLEFFRQALEFQQKVAPPGMKVLNALQTNGTLLDDDWCVFLRENNFLVGLSLDGPQPLHDAYRRDKGGRGTWERVMRAAELLRRHRVEFNILACVNTLTARRPLEVYRFLRDEVQAEFIQFIPIVEPDPEKDPPVSGRSVSGAAYGRFLTAIFDEWLRRDVGKVYVQIFDAALAAWLGQRPGLCIFEPTCGAAMALEHNGDLYACDHFVSPEYFLGNITQTPLAELAASPRQTRFGLAKRDTLPRYCLECPVRFICNGGCPKERLARAPDGQPGLNSLCAGYRAFFTHIDGPMRVMADLLRQGRAPAEIMSMPPPPAPATPARPRHRKARP